MVQLPEAGVTPPHHFTHTGVDYAGPINIQYYKGNGINPTRPTFVYLSVHPQNHTFGGSQQHVYRLIPS